MAEPDIAMHAIGGAEAVAVAWQPIETRPLLYALLAFDARLARQVARAREPLIGQIGLAWWRERLADGSRDEPLLAALRDSWGERATRLSALIDGWEELLQGSPLDSEAIARFAAGRGAAMGSFADTAGVASARGIAETAGRRWALARLASISTNADEREQALLQGRSLPQPVPLPRSLRGVAVLAGLSARALRWEEPLLAGRAAAAVALRLGMFGR